jgi:LmbE family N-acetylglucosaminyl deacetylase
MAIFPHPDDETLGMGPTLAKYSAEGVKTYLLCATRGERGWNGPVDENPGLEALGKIREGELRCAAEKLGLYEVTHLDYIDGDVDRANPQEIIEKIATHLRRIRPQVVVTFGYDGNYGHPDHIALAQFTASALVCAADCGYADSTGQVKHRVSKFYHMVDSKTLVEALKSNLGEISMEIDGVERKQIGWDDWAISAQIDASTYFEKVWDAVLCHKSQLAGYGPLIDLPKETLRQFFSKGSFIRVFSEINSGRKVEQDLFEGLR